MSKEILRPQNCGTGYCSCIECVMKPSPNIQRYLEKDNPLSFQPDWADFKNGRAEAFEQIADKIKAMPWENDTKDSFIVWLKEQA